MAGIDFPFGLPQEFVADTKRPPSWSAYVKHAVDRTREEFCSLLQVYAAGRPKGRKQHLPRYRPCGECEQSDDVFLTPVAKMLYEGAIRLAQSPVSIVSVRPTSDRRIIVEAYPALVAASGDSKETLQDGAFGQMRQKRCVMLDVGSWSKFRAERFETVRPAVLGPPVRSFTRSRIRPQTAGEHIPHLDRAPRFG